MPGRCLLTVLSLAAMLVVGCESAPPTAESHDPSGPAARGDQGGWSFELLPTPTDTESVLVADAVAAAAARQADRRAEQKLRKELPAQFEANRLVNVIDYLRMETGAQFVVNWGTLEAAGIEQDSPVTLHLTPLPAEQVLKLVLQQVGGGIALDPIGYRIIEGVVHVSTQRDLDNVHHETRIYNVRDLISDSAELDSGADRESRDDRVETLHRLVLIQIGEDGWVGGTPSTFGFHDGDMLIKTTTEKHEKIVHLFAALRLSRQRAGEREARHRR